MFVNDKYLLTWFVVSRVHNWYILCISIIVVDCVFVSLLLIVCRLFFPLLAALQYIVRCSRKIVSCSVRVGSGTSSSKKFIIFVISWLEGIGPCHSDANGCYDSCIFCILTHTGTRYVSYIITVSSSSSAAWFNAIFLCSCLFMRLGCYSSSFFILLSTFHAEMSRSAPETTLKIQVWNRVSYFELIPCIAWLPVLICIWHCKKVFL